MNAEIDHAENQLDLGSDELTTYVDRFLAGDFELFDADLAAAAEGVPEAAQVAHTDDSADEVAGWLELHARQDYAAAEQHFAARAKACQERDVHELGAFARYTEAKAAHLLGGLGDAAARARAPELMEEAINWGGTGSSWFNRLRASTLRAQDGEEALAAVASDDHAAALIERFDALLEKVGTKGDRFERWRTQLKQGVASDSHSAYQEALERFGHLLGYDASRPKYGAATDCRWRAVFGNTRELVTFEAKIEHEASNAITPSALGQAHNQRERALAQFAARGYRVRATIVTHLTQLEAAASSSLGEVRVVKKEAVAEVLDHVCTILSIYRDAWSADAIEARVSAAEAVKPKLPPSGWLTRALAHDEPFVDAAMLLREWP